MQTDFRADLAERTVLITCPDNDHGGAVLPADGWEDRAQADHPTLHDIEGPFVSGAYIMRWRDDPATDTELLERSLRIVRSEPARNADTQPNQI